ncbi:MAG: ATP-binding cassette domain-containing protein, partial [Acutalibacteraceae bacterium]
MTLLSANNLTVSFSERNVLDEISFQVEEKNKIGLVGANGAGKTTLFKTITKEYQPSAGNISIGKETVIGYMEQHACASSEKSMFDELMSVFSYLYEIEDELSDIEKNLSEHNENFTALLERQQFLHEQYERMGGLTYKSRARSALLGIGFDEKDFPLPCSLLSGGQRSKLSLCKLLLSGANLMLLDEPTNHLDIESVSWLENWLCEYNGSFIVISHDRYFLDKVTNRTFELERGHLYSADRNYSAYIALKEERRKADERVYENTMKEVHRIEGSIEQQK